MTVGNSSQVTDGAAAVVVTPGEAARAEGRRPLGYLRAFAYAGCDPERMGLGPAFAVSKLLEQDRAAVAGLRPDRTERGVRGGGAGQRAGVRLRRLRAGAAGREAALGAIDPARLNVNGGAIALGHPVGATGTRLVLTLLKELRRRGLRRGLATLCVGGGQGGAVFVEAGD